MTGRRVLVCGGRAFNDAVDVFPADWSKHGRAAGPIRNETMLRIGRPDMVVAFDGGKGTADMVRKAELAGVPVLLAKDIA